MTLTSNQQMSLSSTQDFKSWGVYKIKSSYHQDAVCGIHRTKYYASSILVTFHYDRSDNQVTRVILMAM